MVDYSSLVPRFDLKDSGLPLLISEAAIDMDNIMKGISDEDKTIAHLSSLLYGLTQGEKPGALGLDNTVLAYAISGREKFEEYWKGKNTSEVLLQVNLAARELKDFKSLSREQQKSLLDFCCNLSTEVGRNYQEYYARTSKLAA